jgi:hypothetical protein
VCLVLSCFSFGRDPSGFGVWSSSSDRSWSFSGQVVHSFGHAAGFKHNLILSRVYHNRFRLFRTLYDHSVSVDESNNQVRTDVPILPFRRESLFAPWVVIPNPLTDFEQFCHERHRRICSSFFRLLYLGAAYYLEVVV